MVEHLEAWTGGSPERDVEACIARIARLDPAINAFVDLDLVNARVAARESAIRWREGRPLSPIDGMPMGIKCNIAVRGLPWSAGIGARLSRIAERDAGCVARLRAAGAVILGTLNMDEAALGASGDNPWLGRTHNPHRHGYTPGGSSSGPAAAVAAGLCVAALGTDTMGSVRIPAACCGVVGWLPSAGRIPSEGVAPLSPSYDRVGILARSIGDCARVLEVFGGHETRTAVPEGLAAWELPAELGVDPDVRDACRATIERLRAAGQRVNLIPLPSYATALLRDLLLIVEVEGALEYQDELADPSSAISPRLRRMFDWGAAVSAEKADASARKLAAARDAIRRELAPYRALITPTVPETARGFDAQTGTNPASFTAIASIAGLPAWSIPAGFDRGGMPIGVQWIGLSDAALPDR